MTILLVEHDMELAMSIANRLVVLHYATKIAKGMSQKSQSNPKVIRAYLGTDWQEEWLSSLLPEFLNQ